MASDGLGLQFVQGFDVPTLAALLLIPVLIAALARKVVLALASVLLSIVSLMLIINPASAASVLGVAGRRCVCMKTHGRRRSRGELRTVRGNPADLPVVQALRHENLIGRRN
jgi:hypothetical protein